MARIVSRGKVARVSSGDAVSKKRKSEIMASVNGNGESATPSQETESPGDAQTAEDGNDDGDSPTTATAMRKSSRSRKEPQRFSTAMTGKENENVTAQPNSTKRRKTARQPLAGRQAESGSESDEADAVDGMEEDEDEANEVEDRDESYGARTGAQPRPRKSDPATSRPRKVKPKAVRGANGGATAAENTLSLYDSLSSSTSIANAAIESLASHWAQSYLSSSRIGTNADSQPDGAAIDESHSRAWSEFLNLILRASGCTNSVRWEDATDLDRVVESITEIQSNLKRDEQANTAAQYPLINKGKDFKKLRNNLSAFIRSWCLQAAEAEILYDDGFLEVAQSWLSALSTSGLRNFRHTATFAALCIERALAEVWRDAIKTRESLSRQLQTENSRSRVNQARSKSLQDQLTSNGQKEDLVHGFVDDWFSTIFLHRYRDVEPAIRIECVLALTSWFDTLPEHFLTNDYLKYIGWTLSDKSPTVRLEALRAVQKAIAESAEQANAQQVRQFLDRFKTRLLEIAQRDVDSAVRVSAIGLCKTMGEKGYLSEALQNKLHCMIFDKDAEVRQAIAGLIAKHADSQTQEVWARQKVAAKDQNLWTLHTLTKTLFKLQAQIDKDRSDSNDTTDAHSHDVATKDTLHQSRFALAVRALWTDMPVLGDIKSICRYILIDHTTTNIDKQSKGLQLSSSEETALLEILLGSMLRLSEDYVGEEGNLNQFERDSCHQKSLVLTKAIGQLHEKHQTYPDRLYLILQMVPLLSSKDFASAMSKADFETLWLVINNHFLNSTESRIIEAGGSAVHFLSHAGEATASDVSFEKMHEVYRSVTERIRASTHSDGHLELAGMETGDHKACHLAVLRLLSLAKRSDIHALFEDSSEGAATPLFDLLMAIIGASDDNDDDSVELVRSSIEASFMYLTWRFLSIGSDSAGYLDDDEKRDLKARESKYIELLRRTVSQSTDQKVADTAFQHLGLTLEMLSSDFITSDDHPRNREARFLQYPVSSSVQRDLCDHINRSLTDYSRGSTEERAILLQDLQFIGNLSIYGRLLCKGVVDQSLAAPLFQIIGTSDEPLLEKMVSEVRDCIRDAGLSLAHPESTKTLVVGVLKDAFTEYMTKSIGHPLESITKVSRLLSGLTVSYGAGLKITERLRGSQMFEIHTTLADFIISSVSVTASGKADAKRLQPLLLFKTLIPLVPGLHLNDALRVKAHLDKAISTKGLKPLAIGMDKSWDAYHSYLKRFDGLISKSGVDLDFNFGGQNERSKKKEQPKARPTGPRLLEDPDDPIESPEPLSELTNLESDNMVTS